MQKQSIHTDVLIVGSGVAGLFAALTLPEHQNILIITKDAAEQSDSFLAQGGICVLRDANDYENYYNDTLKAGHFENNPAAVHVMIASSRPVIDRLITYGVPFEQENGKLLYTREGAHSLPRILYHKDQTGKAITSALLEAVRRKPNITLMEYTEMLDLLTDGTACYGAVANSQEHGLMTITASFVLLATGGVGGLYPHSTNFRHLTGDGVAMALRHHIDVQDLNYVQIHPTSLYSEQPGRSFLISESLRGEGAVLINKDGKRFTDELQPRDIVANAILNQMQKDGTDYVRLSLEHMDDEMILHHFPTIYQHCLNEGYDITREPIPVVPAQHYFMGGVKIDLEGRTSMKHLYAAGETACNGVHGANRLASNSLLESLVFAERAAIAMMAEPHDTEHLEKAEILANQCDLTRYQNIAAYQKQNHQLVRTAIQK